MTKLHFEIKNEKRVDLNIYKGFKTYEQLLNFAGGAGIPFEYMIVVCFMDEYYIVLYESFEKQIIIGGEIAWYRYDGKFNCIQGLDDFELPYQINGLKKNAFRHLQLADNLRQIDSLITVKMFTNYEWKDLTKFKYSKIYIILLGLTFCETFFTREEFFKYLGDYYDFEPYQDAFRDKNIVSINPFKGMVQFEDGKESFYRFDYALYSPQHYYRR